jgi:hypothetical protein
MVNNITFRNKAVPDPSQDGDVTLGNIARIVSAPKPLSSAYSAKIERFRLQSVARFLLPNERVSKCLRSLVPHRSMVDVMYSPSVKAAHYKNLQVCGSVWSCPVCAAKITERRRADLDAAIKVSPHRILMASYTLKHDRGMSLQSVLDALQGAYRWLRGTRAWVSLMAETGLVGSVRVLEVTHGEANGWHPHIHELLFLPAGISERKIAALRGAVTKMWIAALERRGFTADKAIGFHLRSTDGAAAGYITTWGAAAELAKMPMKRGRGDHLSPMQLLALAEDDYRAATLWTEYALVFKGKHQLQWSRGLRELLALPDAEKTDEELATEEREDAYLLAALSLVQWKDILFLGLRGELLNVASTGDGVLLLDWLAGYGIQLE